MNYSPRASAAILLLVLGTLGCSEMTAPQSPAAGPPGVAPLALSLESPCGDPLVVPLVIGGAQGEIGTVTVSNDESQLYVTLAVNPGWAMTGTQIDVCSDLRQIEVNRAGNPRLKRFAFRETHEPPVTQYTCSVLLENARYQPGDTVYVAAHAQVVRYNAAGRPTRRASAWGAGSALPGPNRAMVLTYRVQACDVVVPCALTIVWPNGGESICEGDTAAVAWSVAGGCAQSVRIELLLGGSVCQLLAESAPNSGAFQWEGVTRTEFETDGYLLRITAVDGGGDDVSDAPFAIDQCGGPEE
jgi:hypothetical protein